MVKTYIFPFFSRRSLSLQNLCNLPQRFLSVHSCYKNYKNFWTKFYYRIMKFKNFSLKKNFFSLCCRAAGDVISFSLSLSLSLSSLCVIYHHRGRSSVHSHGSFPPPPTHPPPPPQTCWNTLQTHTNTHTHTHTYTHTHTHKHTHTHTMKFKKIFLSHTILLLSVL